LIDRSKALSHVAFQDKDGLGVVFGSLPAKGSESVEGLMRAFPYSTGVGISDKGPIKERIEDTIDGVMEEAVSHAGLMNRTGFWVRDTEGMVGTVGIGFVYEVTMKREDIVHQVQFECLHVLFLGLASYELLPGLEEIFGRDDIIVSET